MKEWVLDYLATPVVSTNYFITYLLILTLVDLVVFSRQCCPTPTLKYLYLYLSSAGSCKND